MQNFVKIVRCIFRLLVGATFIFSGFVKMIDPIGYSYKIVDYLDAMKLSPLIGAALTLAVILSVIELVIGFSLFFRQLPKLGALGALLMLAFFTPLTLWLAIANPVSDCGCFGDALVLTNWQTFFKNLFLLAMAIVLFIQRKQIPTSYNPPVQWIIMVVVGVTSLVLSLYCLNTLPIIDYRPYHIGANIKEGMEIPPDAPRPVYEQRFIYERVKDGERVIFNADNAPTGDPEWKFIDADHKLIDPGYVPPIHDFSINSIENGNSSVDVEMIELFYKDKNGELLPDSYDVSTIPEDESYTFSHYKYADGNTPLDMKKLVIKYLDIKGNEINLSVWDNPKGLFYDSAIYDGGDVTSIVLGDEDYSFLMIFRDVDIYDEDHIAEFDSIADFANKNGIGFYCLTSSSPKSIESFKNKFNPKYKFYDTDGTTLKTIVRSNPGLLLLRKGTIIGKWHDGNLPTVKELEKELTGTVISKQHDQRNRLVYAVWILSVLLAMALIRLGYNWLVKNRYINEKKDLI